MTQENSVHASIHYDHARDTAYGGVLSLNLKDLVRCFGLNGFRSKHPKAACDGVFAPGLVRLKITDVPPPVVFAVLEAFRKSMAKNGFRLLFSYDSPGMMNAPHKRAA